MHQVASFALRHRALTFAVMIGWFAAAIVGFVTPSIGAYREPGALVDVVTRSRGQSADEVGRSITTPIEIQMAGVPHVKTVRAISLFGLSDVVVRFTGDVSYDEAEHRAADRLNHLGNLSNGVRPQLSPLSSIGEIYRYRLYGPTGYSVTDLKTLQDWVLERRLKDVPGVTDVSGWEGKTENYDVNIDKNKLTAAGVSLPQVLSVIGDSSINVGGQTVSFGPRSAIVRGVGLIHSADQLRDTLLTASNGAPVRLGDLATIFVGRLPRLGVGGRDNDDDIVQGVVLIRSSESGASAIKGVEAEVEKINTTGVLPPGVQVVKLYERSDLIPIAAQAGLRKLAEGMILIFVAAVMFQVFGGGWGNQPELQLDHG
jgi:cobalt-zinc-cadmium resistance protein CzcA